MTRMAPVLFHSITARAVRLWLISQKIIEVNYLKQQNNVITEMCMQYLQSHFI